MKKGKVLISSDNRSRAELGYIYPDDSKDVLVEKMRSILQVAYLPFRSDDDTFGSAGTPAGRQAL